MIINADIVVPHLRERAGSSYKEDAPIACPVCGKRTGLYALKDGRRKCGACGKKFTAVRLRDERKLRQYANILLCFCMEFTASRAASVTKYRYHLVLEMYTNFRELLAHHALKVGQRSLLVRKRGSKNGPIFGVRMQNGRVLLEPLPEEPVLEAVRKYLPKRKVPSFAVYDAFIYDGAWHRSHPQFAHFSHISKKTGLGKLEYFWVWTRERLRGYHAISDRNTGYYLKECEWKYNHRFLPAQSQAILLVTLFPADFLRRWSTF